MTGWPRALQRNQVVDRSVSKFVEFLLHIRLFWGFFVLQFISIQDVGVMLRLAHFVLLTARWFCFSRTSRTGGASIFRASAVLTACYTPPVRTMYEIERTALFSRLRRHLVYLFFFLNCVKTTKQKHLTQRATKVPHITYRKLFHDPCHKNQNKI